MTITPWPVRTPMHGEPSQSEVWSQWLSKLCKEIDTGSIGANAATATALQTARLINAVSFNGTSDIVVPAAAGTLTGSPVAWTPVDASGAGLALTIVDALAYRLGAWVYVTTQLIYPVTANPLSMAIGGLPFPATGQNQALAVGRNLPATPVAARVRLGSTIFECRVIATAVVATNAEMSGINLLVSGGYLTP